VADCRDRGKITAVAPPRKFPTARSVIDFGDATLLPGFIDAHTHLTFPYSDDYKQQRLDNLQKTVAERALDASVNARVTLMAGFTTVRDVAPAIISMSALRNGIRNGDVPGPRMLVTVHALAPPVVTAIMRTDIAREFSATNQALWMG